MNELSNILQLSDEAGTAIVIVVFGYLIIRVVVFGVLKALEIWERVASARQAIDAKRNEIDDRMAAAVAGFADRLEQGTTTTHTMLATSADADRIAHGTTQAYIERVGAEVRASDQKGDQQRKKIAATVVANGTSLDEIKKMINALSVKITPGVVPPEIARELSQISLKINECIVSTKALMTPVAAFASGELINGVTEEKKEG